MTSNELDPKLAHFVKAAMARKATDLVILDVRKLTSFADVFIICSGMSNRQVSAIAENIKDDLRKNGIKPLGLEGLADGQWVLMDYGHILIHVFLKPVREFYDLEGFWSGAVHIPVDGFCDAADPEKQKGEPECP